jgi:hypothetical protein
MARAVEAAGERPARVEQPGTAGPLVLLPVDDYDWVRGLVTGVPDAPRVTDPSSRREYALLPLAAYGRIQPLFEEDPPTLEEQKAALRDAGLRAGWNDPVWDDLDGEPTGT